MTRSRDNGNVGHRAYKKNYLINGDFSIQQRTINSPVVNGDYTLDRWRHFINGGSTVNVIQRFAAAADNLPFVSFMEFNQSVGLGSSIQQRIEEVELGGRTVTVSLYMNSPVVTTVDLTIGGNASTGTNLVSVTETITLLAGWNKYEVIFNISAWVDYGNITDAFIFLTISPNQTGQLYLAQAQLEEGSNATEFEHRPIGEELSLCQRYYEIGTSSFYGDITSGSTYTYRETFKVVKRTPPSMSGSDVISIGFVALVGAFDANIRNFIESRIAQGTQAAGEFTSSWAADAEL